MRRSLILILLLLFCGRAEAMQSMISGGTGGGNLSATATNYVQISESRAISATETDRQALFAQSGTVSDLYVELSADPSKGSGVQSYAITLIIGGSSALTCTVSEGATTCNSGTSIFAATAGNTIDLKSVPANTPTVAAIQFTFKFHSNTTALPNRHSLFFGGTLGVNLSTSASQFVALHGGVGPGGTEISRTIYIPTPGTISRLYVELGTAPGAGDPVKSRTFTVNKNGSTAGIACTISSTATTCNDTSTAPVAVVAGDKVSLATSLANTPAASVAFFGLMFEATNDGESIGAQSNTTALTTGSATYRSPFGNFNAQVGTETSQQQLDLVTMVRTMYVLLDTDPANGAGVQSYKFDFRDNVGDQGPSCTISEGATTCNASTDYTFAASGNMAIEITPANTPTAPLAQSGVIFYTAPRRKVIVT